MSLCGLKRGDTMCAGTSGFTVGGKPLTSEENKAFGPSTGWLNDINNVAAIQRVADVRSKGQLPSAVKESTPSLPKSSGDSGLSIRRSSRSSSNTSNRRGGSSRAGARKRYKTT